MTINIQIDAEHLEKLAYYWATNSSQSEYFAISIDRVSESKCSKY